MNSYVILLRGINVGGKNKLPMAALKQFLEEQGFNDVITYVQSGNAVLRSNLSARAISERIEAALPRTFKLDSSIIKVLALDHKTFQKIIAQAPQGFGEDDTSFRYNVIFLMGVSSDEAIDQIDVRQGIDEAWRGDSVIYYRLPSLSSPDATKSYLGKLAKKPLYQSVTIRNWNTTTKLLEILDGYKT